MNERYAMVSMSESSCGPCRLGLVYWWPWPWWDADDDDVHSEPLRSGLCLGDETVLLRDLFGRKLPKLKRLSLGLRFLPPPLLNMDEGEFKNVMGGDVARLDDTSVVAVVADDSDSSRGMAMRMGAA
jgi:hypothetical protein